MAEFSKKPIQPPSGADFSQLVKKVNEIATKTGVKPLSSLITGRIPAWKRWVGGEAEFDGDKGGLRDVVNANALALDALKNSVDIFKQNNAEVNATQNQRLAAIEAQLSSNPFPG